MVRTKVLMVALGVSALSPGAIGVVVGRGQEDHLSTEARIGLRIAPVPLNLKGKDRELVGLGSYIVNAQGGCNDCHNNGTQYLPGGNPFQGQPKRINAAGYLTGGAVVFGVTAPNLRPELGTTPRSRRVGPIASSSKRCGSGSAPTMGTSCRSCPGPIFWT